ncbi:hypothetical protein XELAEV_18037927mg [Xenopus laevis]|uniref:Uncharacterized protein n=1 Tax=Xenopus laevis TaxID=8355 RepID=A0A974CD54_XENLA|nr:hypothetical protein XELAEV_18037927mg [Xenopus laevis]
MARGSLLLLPLLLLLLSPLTRALEETLMDSTTATAELGWTVRPTSGAEPDARTPRNSLQPPAVPLAPSQTLPLTQSLGPLWHKKRICEKRGIKICQTKHPPPLASDLGRKGGIESPNQIKKDQVSHRLLRLSLVYGGRVWPPLGPQPLCL